MFSLGKRGDKPGKSAALRDARNGRFCPRVKTRGYYRVSLRDSSGPGFRSSIRLYCHEIVGGAFLPIFSSKNFVLHPWAATGRVNTASFTDSRPAILNQHLANLGNSRRARRAELMDDDRGGGVGLKW